LRGRAAGFASAMAMIRSAMRPATLLSVMRPTMRSAMRSAMLACMAAIATAIAAPVRAQVTDPSPPAVALAPAGDPSAALAQVVALLGSGTPDDRYAAVDLLAATGGDAAIRILRAIRDGSLSVTSDGTRLLIGRDQRYLDPLTDKPAAAPETPPTPVAVNNRLRNAISTVLASIGLTATDPAQRRAAALALQERPDPTQRDRLKAALAAERDAGARVEMSAALGMLDIKSEDPAIRAGAATALGNSERLDVRSMLEAMTARKADGTFAESDAAVRAAAVVALATVERRLTFNEYLGRAFAGISLGSILMLAAMGLAITYGLLGVINMAHGEMIMIGAYCAWIMQGWVRRFAPTWFDAYPILALPLAFVACAIVGIVIERLVIRHLYGRPLETLLATWGVSLILIQIVRHLFGPQNVEIENPAWMSGGIQWSSLVLPYNRIAIIVFSALVLGAIALVLSRTRLGLFVRGVTQNRPIAGALGVPTARVDMLAFGLGSGIAGLAGVALSQVGNVGPELGQAYIIDSFIVVVAGGVGQLAGAVVAGLGLGMLSKFIEPSMGAVITKIVILVLIIGFIQRRPQGLFALRERSLEA
jgi:urea transport system permease protein